MYVEIAYHSSFTQVYPAHLKFTRNRELSDQFKAPSILPNSYMLKRTSEEDRETTSNKRVSQTYTSENSDAWRLDRPLPSIPMINSMNSMQNILMPMQSSAFPFGNRLPSYLNYEANQHAISSPYEPFIYPYPIQGSMPLYGVPGQPGAAGLGFALRPNHGQDTSSKDWQVYLLHVAHQNYNARDYASAFSVCIFSYFNNRSARLTRDERDQFTFPFINGMHMLFSWSASHEYIL